jgi:hypothetical protein
MRSAPYKARRSAARSQVALASWAKKNGWRLVLLDADSGNPRTGIVDAALIRIAPGSPDTIQVRLVQLKGGRAGLKPTEVLRLKAATRRIAVSAMFAFHDGQDLDFTVFDPT